MDFLVILIKCYKLKNSYLLIGQVEFETHGTDSSELPPEQAGVPAAWGAAIQGRVLQFIIFFKIFFLLFLKLEGLSNQPRLRSNKSNGFTTSFVDG